ncbi:MAG: histidine phosphatase family protein [Geminicoccaceae bacterium]|nr:histidine phosphatase family protein [Geminicoccaceae bacterium]
MRTLCLLRHAKSSWEDPSLDDHDRPLAERGRDAAPRIGAWLRERQIRPDLVLLSSAARTRETWTLTAPSLASSAPTETRADLYLAEPAQLLRVVQETRDAVSTLLLIGHNPGLDRFADSLVSDGKEKPRRRMRRKFPTAALALITFRVDAWPEVAPGSGTLEAFVRPKDLT